MKGRRLAGALALALLAATPTARAQDFAAAVDAFDRGDHISAWFIFWELAQKGESQAQFNLAQMYRLGLGIAPDLPLARRWYEAAALQNHPRAQFSLGVIYELGLGVSRDIPRARSWYQKAAAQNIDQAKEALARLDPGGGRAPAAPATGRGGAAPAR